MSDLRNIKNDSQTDLKARLSSIRQLEELTLSTSPSIHQRNYDGWVLRASNTDTRRANSVSVLHESSRPLDEKIAFCEAWYALHQQRVIFRLTAELATTELDAALFEVFGKAL